MAQLTQPSRPISGYSIGRAFSMEVHQSNENNTGAAFSESEGQLDLALKAVHMATWTWDIHANQIYTTGGELAGINLTLPASPQDFVQQIHPEDRQIVLDAILELLFIGRSSRIEFRVAGQDGGLHWLEAIGEPLFNNEGHVERVLGVIQNITERVVIEKNLRMTIEKLATMIEAAPLAIVTLDLLDNIASWNPAAERMFGWRVEEVLGRPLFTVPSEKLAEFQRLMGQVREGKALSGVEVTRVKRDGTRIEVILFAEALHNQEGEITGTLNIFAEYTGQGHAPHSGE